jgi:hypothetical protein
MSKYLRLSEKWFHRALWLVALVFASFLIGLGSTIIGNLPEVETPLGLEDFMDQAAAAPLRQVLSATDDTLAVIARQLEQAELQLHAAEQTSLNARETFSNWLATRHATQHPDQDAELIARTKALDMLKLSEAASQQEMQTLHQRELAEKEVSERAEEQLSALEAKAETMLEGELRQVQLRVFLYRLLLTLPLLGIAVWLFAKQRKSTYWPFVWGYIFFAFFTFFVELVPYLPSYGGYVRDVVGIVLTVFLGRYAIVALNRYLARQKLAEAQPEQWRRESLNYDAAQARLVKGVCPGCERPADLKSAEVDFCPHCGIGLFDHCGVCTTRKSTFSKFCHACGTPGQNHAATS